MSGATRPNLVRVHSLPAQQVRSFAVANASELSNDDVFSDTSDYSEGSQPGNDTSRDNEDGSDDDDQYPETSILKLPSFFAASNRLLVNAHDEAERQAKQQQMKNYEAVMKRFQVRRVAVRAFSTSNVSIHARSPQTSDHSLSSTSGRREMDATVQQDELERGEQDASSPSQQHSRGQHQSHPPVSADDAAPQPTSAISGTGSRSAGRHSVPRAKTKGYAHSYPPEPQNSTRFTIHRFVVKKQRRLLRRLRRFVTNLDSVIYPTSLIQRVREGVLLNLFVVQLILLPLLPVYFASESALILGLQFVAEWIYFLDCALGFNTAFFQKSTNELVTNRREIAKHYVCGWFAIDLLSSVPVNTLVYLASNGQGLFELSPLTYLFVDNVARVPRFVSFFRTLQALRAAARALRAGQNFWTWVLLYSRYSHLLRIARLVFTVMLLEHYMTCVWQYLTPIEPVDAAAETENASPLELYLRNYYSVVLLIHGQSVDTVSVAQTLYSITAVFMGSFVVAIVFGNVAMLVANFNASATNYQRNMEEVFATMKKMQLPGELQDRIHQFFTHLWQEYDAVDADLVKFPKELTPTLALEVGLCKYMNLITGVPYWRECSPDFVSHVIRNLVVRVYLPDDFVLRQREISHDLFMINRGTCELTHPSQEAGGLTANEARLLSTRYALRRPLASSESHKKHAKFHHSVREVDISSTSTTGSSPFSPELLHSGEVFGGMGLLLNFEQQFNVRAVTHVEMCVLSRHEFQKILMRFQHDRPTVLTALLEDVILKNELPFSMDDVFGVSVVDDEQSSDEMAGHEAELDSSRPEAQASDSKSTKLTLSEAADFLMRKINHEGVDPSIKFGFQQVNLPPQPSTSQDTGAQNEESESPEERGNQLLGEEQSVPSTRFASFSCVQSSAAGPPGELSVDTEMATGKSSSSDHSELRLASRGSSSTETVSHPEPEARRSSSSHRRRSSTPLVGVDPEQLSHLQDEMQQLATRVEGFEGSQASVLSALEALQQSVARIHLNVMTMQTSSSKPQCSSSADHSDLRTLHRERTIHKVLSLPSNWEQGGQTLHQQHEDVLGEQRRTGFARSNFQFWVSRALSRSQTELAPKGFVPAQPESSRTKSSVQPALRRASMFPRRSPVVTSRPSLTKKRELLADSLWTRYPSLK